MWYQKCKRQKSETLLKFTLPKIANMISSSSNYENLIACKQTQAVIIYHFTELSTRENQISRYFNLTPHHEYSYTSQLKNMYANS